MWKNIKKRKNEFEEKQGLLKFVHSNLKLDGENVLLELHEPFSIIAKNSDQPVWLEKLVALRTFNWSSLQHILALFKFHLKSVSMF